MALATAEEAKRKEVFSVFFQLHTWYLVLSIHYSIMPVKFTMYVYW